LCVRKLHYESRSTKSGLVKEKPNQRGKSQEIFLNETEAIEKKQRTHITKVNILIISVLAIIHL